MAASVSASGSTATLQPSAALAAGTTYTATLLSGSSGVKDLAGNALASNFTWSFTTTAPDTTPPTVSAVTPANGARERQPGDGRERHLQRADRTHERHGHELRPSRPGRKRRRGLRLGIRLDGDAAAERELASSTTYTATLSPARAAIEGSGRERARLGLHLVVHDRRSGHDPADRLGRDAGRRRDEREPGDERERHLQRADRGRRASRARASSSETAAGRLSRPRCR